MKFAFRMKLKNGMFNQYKSRHKQVYTELVLEFTKAGVSDYSIWYDQSTDYLFAYVQLENKDIWDAIATTDACKQWWKFMAPLMEVNSDNSPVVENLQLAYEL